MLFTPSQLDELRRAAEASWTDETRHAAYQGHPRRCLGQCYVTSRWVQSLHGGHVARKDGHYFWLSPNKASALDLAADHTSQGEPLYRAATHPFFDGAEVLPEVAHARTDLFVRRANRALEALRQGVKLS